MSRLCRTLGGVVEGDTGASPQQPDFAPATGVVARNPRLFVVGCPRSGTTLLQRMLDNHPDLTVANDTHFIPKALRAVGATGDVPLTPDRVAAVRGYRRFPRLGLGDHDVDEAAPTADTYGQFVSAL